MSIYRAVSNSRGTSIELSGAAARTKFLNVKNRCKEFDGGKIKCAYRRK